MAISPTDSSSTMSSQIVSTEAPLQPAFVRHLALAGALDEISNIPGRVREYIYHQGNTDKATGLITWPLLFFVYQTTRYGPQNGFRLCIVHRDYHIGADTKADGEPEDDIDRLEKPIPQDHMEVVVLGDTTPIPDPESEDEDSGSVRNDGNQDGGDDTD